MATYGKLVKTGHEWRIRSSCEAADHVEAERKLGKDTNDAKVIRLEDKKK